jgi:hypothetical protein
MQVAQETTATQPAGSQGPSPSYSRGRWIWGGERSIKH